MPEDCIQRSEKVEVVEDDDSKPHAPVRFEVQSMRELKEVKSGKIPKQPPGVNGGKALPSEDAQTVGRRKMKSLEERRQGCWSRDPSTLKSNSEERDPGNRETNSQGRGPNTRKLNSQERDSSTRDDRQCGVT